MYSFSVLYGILSLLGLVPPTPVFSTPLDILHNERHKAPLDAQRGSQYGEVFSTSSTTQCFGQGLAELDSNVGLLDHDARELDEAHTFIYNLERPS